MNRAFRFYWHRFREWRHRVLAERAGDRFTHHSDRANTHERAADRILWPPPPRGPPVTLDAADGDRAPPNT